MKFPYVISVYVLVACLYLQANATCIIDGENVPVGLHYHNCIKHTCRKDGSVTAIGCAESRCRPGKLRTWVPLNLKKPYPFCCPYPICNP